MVDAATFLSVASGALVGLILGLIGSGGSILAVPLLVYVVGYAGDPHVAIGTSALAVAASALGNALQHHRGGNVVLRTGVLFAAPGVLGALAGARLGLATDGTRILFLFALVMLVAAYRMWRGQNGEDRPSPRTPHASRITRREALRVMPAGLGVGILSGFFGIGGGFLIVPALVWAADLDVRDAIGTSLLAVTAFGLTTAARYGLAGQLDLPVAALFIAGGLAGGVVGTRLSRRARRETLRRAFAIVLVAVAAFMLYRNHAALLPA